MGLALAKGRLKGKAPKLSAKQEAHLVELYRGGEHTVAEIQELFAVGRSTVYRALEHDDARTPTASLGAAAAGAA